MPLPFWSNVQSHFENEEPIYKALFEITFDFPTILARPATDVKLQLENARSISLPLTPDIEVKTQRFKFSTRAFVTLPTQTHIQDLKIKHNLNQNDKGAVYIWNTLKAWYDLVWNSQTGETHYKKEIIGNIIVNQHDKKGKVIRRVTYRNAQIVGISGFDLSWDDTTEILECESGFVCDWFEDLYIS